MKSPVPDRTPDQPPCERKPRRPAWSGDWQIPRAIALPGVRVRVRVVPGEELLRRGSRYGLWTYSHPDVATVYLNGDLPLEVQRYTLLHELQHALVDALDQAVERHPDAVRSASMGAMAALRLAEVAGAIAPAEAAP